VLSSFVFVNCIENVVISGYVLFIQVVVNYFFINTVILQCIHVYTFFVGSVRYPLFCLLVQKYVSYLEGVGQSWKHYCWF
jgi:hypothetical protein